MKSIDRWVGGIEVPFDSVGSAIEWWFRPLVGSKTWRSMGWLFVGVFWGPLLFSAVLVIVIVTGVASLTGVGLVLVIPAFAVINGLSSAERARASWVGESIAPPGLRSAGAGLWSRITTRLGDGARWQQILFAGLFLIGGPALFALGVYPWTFVFGLIFDANFEITLLGFFNADFDLEAFSLIGLLAGVVLAGGAARITVGVAWLGRAFAESLLGPGTEGELRERVTTLSGQRQQILDAVDSERRRIERNLHDGVQQQLVALGIDIGRAKARVETDPDGARELLDAARDKVRGSIGELRLIGRGLHPAVLEDRGLDAALSAVVAGSPIPISVQIATAAVLPDDVAATAYYVASEAVANILKHSKARIGSIRLEDDHRSPRAVRLTVHDDGRGGAEMASGGSGLAGMRARVEGADGFFDVDSRPGGPTTVVAVLPLDTEQTQPMSRRS
ncbi:MAG: sensor histidine kinase [Ilumatobacter sp.]